MHSPLFAWFFFKGFSMGAMVARAFQSRADMWQLVKELLNYFYLTNLWAKIWLLCVFFMLQGCCCFLFLEATICSYK